MTRHICTEVRALPQMLGGVLDEETVGEESPARTRATAVFARPTDETCYRNYAEGARCGRVKNHNGLCSQVSRWADNRRSNKEP